MEIRALAGNESPSSPGYRVDENAYGHNGRKCLYHTLAIYRLAREAKRETLATRDDSLTEHYWLMNTQLMNTQLDGAFAPRPR